MKMRPADILNSETNLERHNAGSDHAGDFVHAACALGCITGSRQTCDGGAAPFWRLHPDANHAKRCNPAGHRATTPPARAATPDAPIRTLDQQLTVSTLEPMHRLTLTRPSTMGHATAARTRDFAADAPGSPTLSCKQW